MSASALLNKKSSEAVELDTLPRSDKHSFACAPLAILRSVIVIAGVVLMAKYAAINQTAVFAFAFFQHLVVSIVIHLVNAFQCPEFYTTIGHGHKFQRLLPVKNFLLNGLAYGIHDGINMALFRASLITLITQGPPFHIPVIRSIPLLRILTHSLTIQAISGFLALLTVYTIIASLAIQTPTMKNRSVFVAMTEDNVRIPVTGYRTVFLEDLSKEQHSKYLGCEDRLEMLQTTTMGTTLFISTIFGLFRIL